MCAICTCLLGQMYTFTHTPACTYTHTHVHAHTHTRAHTHAHTRAHTTNMHTHNALTSRSQRNWNYRPSHTFLYPFLTNCQSHIHSPYMECQMRRKIRNAHTIPRRLPKYMDSKKSSSQCSTHVAIVLLISKRTLTTAATLSSHAQQPRPHTDTCSNGSQALTPAFLCLSS